MRLGPPRWAAATIAVMSSTLIFLVGYPTVWEYQYTSALPVVATALILHARGELGRVPCRVVAIAGACLWLPSLYILTEGRTIGPYELALVRIDRVLPVTVMFVVLVAAGASRIRREGRAAAVADAAHITSRPTSSLDPSPLRPT